MINDILIFNEDITEESIKELKRIYGIVPDLSTKEGYEFNRVGIRKLVSARVKVDNRKKELKRDIEKEGARIIGEIEALEKPMKLAKQKYDAVIAAEKEKKRKAEEDRVNGLKAKLQVIANFPLFCVGKTSVEIDQCIADLVSIDPMDGFSEFTEEAITSKNESLTKMKLLLHSQRENEENAEKIAKEAKALEAQRLAGKEAADALAAERAEIAKERELLAKEREDITPIHQESNEDDILGADLTETEANDAIKTLRRHATAARPVNPAPKFVTKEEKLEVNVDLSYFEEWLNKVCFQKPTPEAYDLARDAWIEAKRTK